MVLGYLISPVVQVVDRNGTPVVGGKVYVYNADTSILATIYGNDEGTEISNPVLTDTLGNFTIFAETDKTYDIKVFDENDVLLFTKKHLIVNVGEDGFVIHHDDTLIGNGTSNYRLSVVNIPLAVDETMTAYKDTVKGKEALVLGVNGEWFNETFSGALSDKVDLSAFEECCSAMSAAVSGKANSSDLDNYYTKIETDNILNNYVQSAELNNYYKKTETSSKQELQSAFDSIISMSGDSPNISAQSNYPETTAQLNLGSTFDILSGITADGLQNHNITMNGVKYALPDKFNVADTLYNMDVFLPTSSFSAISDDVDDLSGQIQYISGGVDYVSANLPVVPDLSANEWNSVYETVSAKSGHWEAPAGKIYSGIYPIVVNNDTNQISANITFGSGLSYTNGVVTVTGKFDNTAVNNVVQQYSANGKWLTQTALNGYATTATLKLSAQVLSGRDNYLSAAIDYVSANAGRTYTGIEPIYVNNTSNEIGIDQLGFSAGYGIDLQVSGGNTLVISSTLTGDLGHTYSGISPIVVDNNANTISLTGSVGHTYSGIAPITVNNNNDTISISGRDLVGGYGIDIQPVGNYYLVSSNLFPMTANGFSANAQPSAVTLLSQYTNVNLTNSSVEYAQAPTVHSSATWYEICNAAKGYKPPVVSAFRFGSNQTSAIINLNNIQNLQQITFIAPRGYEDGLYSAMFCNGDTMDSYSYKLEIFSGTCQDIVHEQDSSLGDVWCKKVWDSQGFYRTEAL